MAIKKTESGWLVDIQPGGRGNKRYRKTFKIKSSAIRWENALKAKIQDDPEFKLAKKDNRRLSELIELWDNLHGVNLKSRRHTLMRLRRVCTALGNPVATNLTAAMFASYRADRLSEGASPTTINRERAYLASVFGELIRLHHWKADNPLSNVRPFRIDQVELTFLSDNQVKCLLSAVAVSENPDLPLVVDLCLSTGCRWSEATGLSATSISMDPSMVTFAGTKSGKVRSVPISTNLAQRLRTRLSHGSFKSCYSAFRMAVRRSAIELPQGQLAHVLRHTFASVMIQGGCDLLTVQRLLGHSSLSVTMRYAHLAPGQIDKARELNPLARLRPEINDK